MAGLYMFDITVTFLTLVVVSKRFPNFSAEKKSNIFFFFFFSKCLATRVSVQGVKSLGGHFACLCRGFEFYEVKKNCYYFSKKNGNKPAITPK